MIYDFLIKDEENVVVVHCNGGKGRTGTLICSYLLYCGFADSAENAIAYFGWKRFNNGLGITNPS
jgi:protein-tyrosine phosphatase